MRITRQLSPVPQQFRRCFRQYDKDVARRCPVCRKKPAFIPTKIEAAPGMSKEYPPTARAHYPRSGHASAVGCQVRTKLSVPHGVRRAAAIERMPSFAEPEQRTLAK